MFENRIWVVHWRRFGEAALVVQGAHDSSMFEHYSSEEIIAIFIGEV